jgi:hypothetical protein
MVRTALAAALAMCLAAACSQDHDSSSLGDPVQGGDDGEPGQTGLVRGGQVHKAPLASALGASADHALLLAAVQDDLSGQVGQLDPVKFSVRGDTTTESPAGGSLRHIDMVQSIDGVPVHGTYLQLTVRGDGRESRVVGSSFSLYRGARVDTDATVNEAGAAGLARQSLSLDGTAEIVSQEMEVRDLDGTLELTWATALRGSHERSIVIASGPRAGETRNVDERVFATTGNVSGFFVTGGAPGGNGVVTQAGLANVVVASASGAAQTDAAGNYAIDVPETDTLQASLNGRASSVVTDAGAPLTAAGAAGPVLDLVLGSGASGEADLAQVTAYVFVDATRNFVEANGVSTDVLGEPLATNTNIASTCNAFYSPFDRSINFFQSGGGCNNSATDSITAHEYGHFVDDALGGITDGGLSEGWGDLLSCFLLGVPEVGFDLLPGQALRSCLNDYVFPPGGNDEVHNLGQAWAGFAFRAREGLIAKLGPVDGEALARALVLPSLPSNAGDILAAVREVFLRDDDDGDLGNGTPNFDVLLPAAQVHGVDIAIGVAAP